MSVYRILKWSFASLLLLVVVAFGWTAYVIFSFDRDTLPANHGHVEVELFPAEGDRQPLVVAFGGAEGGNAWAGPAAERHRALLREHGYALLAVAYFGTESTPAALDRSPSMRCMRSSCAHRSTRESIRTASCRSGSRAGANWPFSSRAGTARRTARRRRSRARQFSVRRDHRRDDDVGVLDDRKH